LKKRKIAVVMVDRANYGRLQPVLAAIEAHPELELCVIAGGTMVLERFGRAVDVVQGDGHPVAQEVYMELEGSHPITMAKSVGLGVLEFASALQHEKPDVVFLIGDRYEALSAAIAAVYMNICLVHAQGGEVSGSIDESARHAISKMAHFHIPATKRSAEYLVRMGERRDTILTVGCPSTDIAANLAGDPPTELVNSRGSGAAIDLSKPYLLTVFHPVTTEYGGEAVQTRELMLALEKVKMPTLLLWPNIDAGSDHVSKEIRRFREQHKPEWMRVIVNLTPEDYARVLKHAACAVGNSSSFVRDAGCYGTPVVLTGSRQDGREWDDHVTHVPVESNPVAEAIKAQLSHGRYPVSHLYGDGNVSGRIANVLADLTPYLQKRLAYIYEEN
jgi:UDP-hydrolysing UDP-N-acetyl-D-glucosamine 2-epimerase